GSYITIGRKTYSIPQKEWAFKTVHSDKNSLILLFDSKNNDFRFAPINNIHEVEYDDMAIVGFIRRDRKVYEVNGLFKDVGPQPTPETKSLPYILVGDDYSYYTASGDYIDMSDSNNVQFIYNQYDSFLNIPNHKTTKTLLATSPNGNPIYRYDHIMSPVQYTTYKKPKILLIGGTHGHEKQAVYGTLRFFKDFYNGWENQKALAFLKANAHIIHIPLLNPDGYAVNKRNNGNGVDLNRNFPPGWQYTAPNPDYLPEGDQYSGEYPASEIETQTLINLLEQEKDLL